MIHEPLRPLAVPIDGLNFDPANARKHGDKNLAAIKSSLAKFGQRKPIVVQREGMIVRAGNGTLAAAKALGWKEIAAVIIDDDNATASQFAIADNRAAELAEWDNETLALLLDGWDKETQEAVGFDKADIDAVLADLDPPEIVEDEVPDPPVEPITKAGDLWILGSHRLLCGDSTKAEDVARLMGGAKADAVVTDPPYGIGKLMQGGTWAKKQDEQFAMMREWDAETSQVFLDMVVGLGVPSVVWGGNYFRTPPSRCWLVWDKPEFPSMSSAELAWTNMDRNTKRLECPRTHQADGAKEHATQKPVEVMAWSLGFVPEGIVYDPFLGSGTTLIAAEQLGRKCYGMEISPQYCDVIVARWEKLTGKKAELAHG